eukprot:2045629-Heterocapsa_arctica.AAC.1
MVMTSGSEDVQPALQVWLGHRASFDLAVQAQADFQQSVQCDLPTDQWFQYLASVVDEDWRRFCTKLHSSPLGKAASFWSVPARHAV